MALEGLKKAAVELLLIPDLTKSKSASRLQKLLKQSKSLDEEYAQWDNAFSDVRALKSPAIDQLLKSKAEELKGAANQLLNSNPKDAQQLYTAAILLTPENHLLFSNRSAAFMKLELYQKALEDAYKVIALAPSWPKGYLRQGNALEAIPRLEEAKKAYANAEGLEAGSATEDVARIHGKIEAEE
jgi:tetratricopeptide (TPR) repeat protein